MVDPGQIPILSLERAGFSYGNTPVFRDTRLQLAQGEILCLLGPNGCGKTTLLDCIMGMHGLGEGRIRLAGQDIKNLSPQAIARKAAYVPQQPGIPFSFSVLDILLMGRTPYLAFHSGPGDADREAALDLLASAGLSHLAHRDVRALSGGEAQLVMILRALLQETPMIIMDEPTAHLDFRNELMVLETIRDLVRHKGITLVMATHFPNHVLFLETAGVPVRTAFMHRAILTEAGPPSRALTRENLARYYGVDARMVSHDIPGQGPLKQVIALGTLEETR